MVSLDFMPHDTWASGFFIFKPARYYEAVAEDEEEEEVVIVVLVGSMMLYGH